MRASKDQELELLKKLATEGELVFPAIYNLHFSSVYKYALSVIKSPDLAEDIAQETFVKLWEQRENILPDRSLQPYLFTLTRNACLNVIRRASRETGLVKEIIDHAVVQAENGFSYTQLKQTSEVFRLAVSQLPPQRKAIYDLCRNQGYSYRQTAEKLGIKDTTVNSQMVKALKFIKDFMVRNEALLACAVPSFIYLIREHFFYFFS